MMVRPALGSHIDDERNSFSPKETFELSGRQPKEGTNRRKGLVQRTLNGPLGRTKISRGWLSDGCGIRDPRQGDDGELEILLARSHRPIR